MVGGRVSRRRAYLLAAVLRRSGRTPFSCSGQVAAAAAASEREHDSRCLLPGPSGPRKREWNEILKLADATPPPISVLRRRRRRGANGRPVGP